MAAIGSCWAPDTWDVDAWAADTWADAAPPPATPRQVPSPHRLAYVYTPTGLDWTGIVPTLLAFDPVTTSLAFYTPDGALMAQPLIFTAGETGPIVLKLTGSDGSAPDLTTASAVTFSLQDEAGTLVVSAVSLTSLTATGEGTWTRTALQTAMPGDYIGQVKVTDSGGNVSYYPDGTGSRGFSGASVTMLRAVGT